MQTRRSFLIAGLSFTAALIAPSAGTSWAATTNAYMLNATAITQVFGDGQRLVAIAVEYDRTVDTSLLSADLYMVESRTVTRVYANSEPALSPTGNAGTFVIVELSPDDANATLYRMVPGGGTTRLPAAATVNIKLPGSPPPKAPGAGGPPVFGSEPMSLPTDRAVNLIVDDFTSDIFVDPATGNRLAYNIFVPKGQDPAVALPLVLFMHDAGATNTVVDTTLVQGLGAVSWASEEDQKRHPAIVVAPQYAEQVVNDKSEATSALDTTLHLLDWIATRYPVDRNRIYTTGQSGGGMMSIAMLVKEPDLFAAAFLVACQWDPTVIAPLARQKLWVMVSEGDAKAFPGQNSIMEVIEHEGTEVARRSWDGTSSEAQFETLVADQESLGASVNYTTLKLGTVVPKGQDDNPGSNHVNTWRIAYAIPGIRDWIMKQKK